MKGKFLFSLMIASIAVLVATLAWQSKILFKLATDDDPQVVNKSRPAKAKESDYVHVTTDETVLIGKKQVRPEPKPDDPYIPAKPKDKKVIAKSPVTPKVIRIEPQQKTAETTTEKKPTINASIGKICSVKGTAHIIAAKTKKKRFLTTSMPVYLNDKIETSKNSKVDIEFLDGSVISQGENTSIVIDEYLFDNDKKDDSCFAMRFIKGSCRVVTGLITDINPKRFEVKTRLASIGIRGCDLAFRSSKNKNDIYIMALSGEKNIYIKTTKNGAEMLNIETGVMSIIDTNNIAYIDIDEPGQHLSVIEGKGFTIDSMTIEDTRGITRDTSQTPPTRYEVIHRLDGAEFKIKSHTPSTNSTKETTESVL